MNPPLQAGNALQSAAAEAARRAAARLIDLQAPDGSWRGAITSAISLDPEKLPPGDAAAAVKLYAALKVSGASINVLERLREQILATGGLDAVSNAPRDLPLAELKKQSGLQKLLSRFKEDPKGAVAEAAEYHKAVLAPLVSGGVGTEPVRDTALAVRALASSVADPAAIGRAADWLHGQAIALPFSVGASVQLALSAAGRPARLDAPARWESADVAGVVLEARAIRSGVDWLVAHQEFDGSWAGRWGIAHLYGTCFALRGLAAAGESDREAHVLRAGEWIRSIQNADGGWGESGDSLERGAFVPGPSTPSQTAWSVLGLIAGGDPDSLSVRHGVEHLIRGQLADGSWTEDQPTGVALPGAVIVRRELDKDVFPLMALAEFAKAQPNV